jgi:hypothetical protein
MKLVTTSALWNLANTVVSGVLLGITLILMELILLNWANPVKENMARPFDTKVQCDSIPGAPKPFPNGAIHHRSGAPSLLHKPIGG